MPNANQTISAAGDEISLPEPDVYQDPNGSVFTHGSGHSDGQVREIILRDRQEQARKTLTSNALAVTQANGFGLKLMPQTSGFGSGLLIGGCPFCGKGTCVAGQCRVARGDLTLTVRHAIVDGVSEVAEPDIKMPDKLARLVDSLPDGCEVKFLLAEAAPIDEFAQPAGNSYAADVFQGLMKMAREFRAKQYFSAADELEQMAHRGPDRISDFDVLSDLEVVELATARMHRIAARAAGRTEAKAADANKPLVDINKLEREAFASTNDSTHLALHKHWFRRGAAMAISAVVSEQDFKP